MEQQRCGSRGGRAGGRGVESQACLSSTWGARVGEPPLRGRPYCSGVLELFDEGSVVVLGLGHEREQRTSAQARLKAMSPALGKATFRLLNVNQTMAGGQYVEYFLLGFGKLYPNILPDAVAWFGPVPLVVDKDGGIRLKPLDRLFV